MKSTYIFIIIVVGLCFSCKAINPGFFKIVEIEGNYLWGITSFYFSEDTNRFKYSHSVSQIHRHSAGQYFISDNYLIIDSDIDIDALPIETSSSESSTNKKSIVIISNDCTLGSIDKVKFDLIVNDSMKFNFKGSNDTVLIEDYIGNMKLAIDIRKRYEPIKVIRNHQTLYKELTPNVGINMFYNSEVVFPDVADTHNLSFCFDRSFFQYETFIQDSFEIINKNTIKRLNDGFLYKNE